MHRKNDCCGSLSMAFDYCRQAIDTGAGKITFDAPIQVAKVVADSEVHESGVQVFPSYGDTKYQVHCRAIAFGSFFLFSCPVDHVPD